MNIFPRLVEIAYSLHDPKDELNFHLSAIVNKSKLLALSQNSPKTHAKNRYNPKFGRDGNDITSIKQTCSELAVLIKFRNKTNIDINKCNLINIRINREGKLSNSCPCQSCRNLILFYQPREVYFTNSFGTFEKYY